jgi:hypothetical protein
LLLYSPLRTTTLTSPSRRHCSAPAAKPTPPGAPPRRHERPRPVKQARTPSSPRIVLVFLMGHRRNSMPVVTFVLSEQARQLPVSQCSFSPLQSWIIISLSLSGVLSPLTRVSRPQELVAGGPRCSVGLSATSVQFAAASRIFLGLSCASAHPLPSNPCSTDINSIRVSVRMQRTLFAFSFVRLSIDVRLPFLLKLRPLDCIRLGHF